MITFCSIGLGLKQDISLAETVPYFFWILELGHLIITFNFVSML